MHQNMIQILIYITIYLTQQGFPQVLRTGRGSALPIGGGGGGSSQFDGRGGLSQNMAGAWEELKMPSTNTCEGVHVIVKLSAILQLHFYLQQN